MRGLKLSICTILFVLQSTPSFSLTPIEQRALDAYLRARPEALDESFQPERLDVRNLYYEEFDSPLPENVRKWLQSGDVEAKHKNILDQMRGNQSETIVPANGSLIANLSLHIVERVDVRGSFYDSVGSELMSESKPAYEIWSHLKALVWPTHSKYLFVMKDGSGKHRIIVAKARFDQNGRHTFEPVSSKIVRKSALTDFMERYAQIGEIFKTFQEIRSGEFGNTRTVTVRNRANPEAERRFREGMSARAEPARPPVYYEQMPEASLEQLLGGTSDRLTESPFPVSLLAVPCGVAAAVVGLFGPPSR